jgi:endonuclease/exonuclease/phosphatase family metal-dependent hydrolase
VRGLSLTDAWNAHTAKTTYTHYTAKEASIIDRIYISNNTKSKKIGIETVATAFTDHFAVVLRIAIDAPILSRGKDY